MPASLRIGTSRPSKPSREARPRRASFTTKSPASSAPTISRPPAARSSSTPSARTATSTPRAPGKLMKAGSKIRFNMHYHSVGEVITDRSQVGIGVLSERLRAEARRSTRCSRPTPTISTSRPAPTTCAAMRTTRWRSPARLVGFMPHMHNRGKRQCLEAIYPSMVVEQLNCVNYDFQWQIVYNYADDVAPLLPAGTIMHVISWHDNSAGNRNNPGSAQLGGLRQPHHRRHGAALADLLLHDRRGVQSRSCRAQSTED